LALLVALWATMVLGAAEPSAKVPASKSPWQRLLQGDEARKAAEQERELARLKNAAAENYRKVWTHAL